MRAAVLLSVASVAFLSSSARALEYEIASCDDFSAVDDELAARLIITSDEIACDKYTRLRIRNSTVITASVDTVTFKNFALKVFGDLTMEPNVVFQDVVESSTQGGALSVQADASTVFKGTAHFQDLSVIDIFRDGEVVTRRGGAILNKGSLVFEGDSSFLRCEAKGLGDSTSEASGGAISNSGKGEIVFKGKLTMEENKADGSSSNQGGAIFNQGGIIVEGESYFRGNSAGQGGAIAQQGNAEILLNNFVTFQENSCALGGGAIFNSQDSDVELNAGVLFVSNIVDPDSGHFGYGGGLFTSGGVVTFGGSTTFRSNKATVGGAISIVNGLSVSLLPVPVTPDDDGSWDPAIIIYPEDPSDLVFRDNDALACPDIYPNCLD